MSTQVPARVVVGAAIVRDGRLLAARRTAPPDLAGRWELPGGKVEPGESDAAALVREIREELDVQVRVERWLPEEELLAGGPVPVVLRVAVARLEAGEPRAQEHDRLRWLEPGELDEVDWVAADRRFVSTIATLLVDGEL